MLRPREADLYIGQVLGGRFLIEDYVGRGHFSLVFSALDRSQNARVAVKVLIPWAEASAQSEFKRECELLAYASKAENVIRRIYDGTDHEAIRVQTRNDTSISFPTKFLVLERAEASLAELLAFRNKLTWRERLRLYRASVKGVHQLHRLRIVHRDIKAENVLLVLNGADTIAKIADLGRSRLTGKPALFTEEAYEWGRGDRRFAPPELLFGYGLDSAAVGRQADLYCLGSLLFEIVTGQALTSASLGDALSLVNQVPGMTPTQRQREFNARKAEIGARFESSYAIFRRELPPEIRQEGDRLLRQLTHFDPKARTPLWRHGKPTDPWDLQWVLRRIDIMELELGHTTRQRTGRREGGLR